MNRYTLYLQIAIITIILSTACSSNRNHFRIGVSQCSDDVWRAQMNNEIRQEAMFYGDIDLEFCSANNDNETQISQIEKFIEERVDLIIVAPNEMLPITPVVEKAYEKGIRIVVVDRKIATNKYTAFLGADNYEIGALAGDYIAKLLGGRGRVIELSGINGSSAAMERHSGFEAAIAKYPQLSLIATCDTKWEEDIALKSTDSLLRRYKNVDLIFSHNDRTAYGAYKAAVNLGRARDIQFVGIDALNGEGQGIDLVSKAVLDASFLYPTSGNLVMQRAYEILTNQPFERDTKLETATIDSMNARIMQLQAEQIAELDDRVRTLNVRIVSHAQTTALQRNFLIAISLLALMVAGVLVLIIRMLKSKTKTNDLLRERNTEITEQNNQLEEQRDKLIELSKQLEEATNAKLVFFTNISHDFRTPLTLIADPINYIQNSTELTGEQSNLLKIASKNIDILLRLVEQILDFRRWENGKAQIRPTTIDLAQSVKEWTTAFHSSITQRNRRVALLFMNDVDYTATIDREKIERVYFNLLSNALKNSLEGSVIKVELFEEDNMLGIRLTNDSNILTAVQIDNIFERFYKVNLSSEGSGIGLAIAKAYVDLHGGRIAVRSVDNNKKFEITVLLPKEQDITALQLKERPNNIDTTFTYASSAVSVEEEDVSRVVAPLFDEKSTKPVILVVDDNDDIRNYIATLMREEYQIIEAINGRDGVAMATKYIPDIIISDIMMPVMDGIELCRVLKSELITCHIPILMLTACAVDEQRIDGYAQGADSYISKPFNYELLRVRVSNLIENRQRASKGDNTASTSLRENFSVEEKDFVERFNEYINSSLSNSELNVDDMGREMGYSRVQLYRKLKALTGESPNKLLRNARLRAGDYLLRTTNMSISEVAYEVGFTSPSYFSKNYKEFFSVAPSSVGINSKG